MFAAFTSSHICEPGREKSFFQGTGKFKAFRSCQFCLKAEEQPDGVLLPFRAADNRQVGSGPALDDDLLVLETPGSLSAFKT